jgi:uncharacterized protein (TIGR03089 family)
VRELTLGRLLEPALRRDPTGPQLTWYDEAGGQRVELSATTLDNWVAKTANLLDEELMGSPGVVGIRLPAHWQALVVALAAWRAGCSVVLSDAAGRDCDALVVGPDEVALAADAPAGIALALRPLNGRLLESPPPGVLDYAAEVLGHGDAYDGAGSTEPAIPLDTVAPGDRVLLAIARDDLSALVDTAIGVYAAASSLVVCLDADPSAVERRATAERATRVLR